MILREDNQPISPQYRTTSRRTAAATSDHVVEQLAKVL
jgi:hypothetical protein